MTVTFSQDWNWPKRNTWHAWHRIWGKCWLFLHLPCIFHISGSTSPWIMIMQHFVQEGFSWNFERTSLSWNDQWKVSFLGMSLKSINLRLQWHRLVGFNEFMHFINGLENASFNVSHNYSSLLHPFTEWWIVLSNVLAKPLSLAHRFRFSDFYVLFQSW